MCCSALNTKVLVVDMHVVFFPSSFCISFVLPHSATCLYSHHHSTINTTKTTTPTPSGGSRVRYYCNTTVVFKIVLYHIYPIPHIPYTVVPRSGFDLIPGVYLLVVLQ